MYEPLWAKRVAGWNSMYADLKVQRRTEHEMLERAAQAVRHGDLSTRQSARHDVNRARKRRESLLAFTRTTVEAAIQKRIGP
jgi:hypothetical protein